METFASRRPLPLPVWLFLIYLGMLTIFGKGPGYLLFPPFFLGEMLMLLLAVWMCLRWLLMGFPPAMVNPLSVLVMVFMLMGAAHLVGDLSRYSVGDVLRDSCIWYYGVYFFVGLYLASLPRIADSLWRKLVWIWLAAMIWNLVNRFTGNVLPQMGPVVPWRGAPLLGGSGSENVQQMMGGAVLLMLGFPRPSRNVLNYVLVVLLIVLSIFALLTTGARGVKIAVLAAWVVAMLAGWGSPFPVWPSGRRFVALYLIFIILGGVAISQGPGGLYRRTQLKRFAGIRSHRTGTAYWRMQWWRNIYREVRRLDLYNGLGFGISLDRYNPTLRGRHWKFPVRSAHNINVTVFARMGLIGTFVWLLLWFYGLGRMLFMALSVRLAGGPQALERNKETIFWLFFLTATWVNSSFGVLMEGPVLGIWFWFALGFGYGRARELLRPEYGGYMNDGSRR